MNPKIVPPINWDVTCSFWKKEGGGERISKKSPDVDPVGNISRILNWAEFSQDHCYTMDQEDERDYWTLLFWSANSGQREARMLPIFEKICAAKQTDRWLECRWHKSCSKYNWAEVGVHNHICHMAVEVLKRAEFYSITACSVNCPVVLSLVVDS